MKFHYWNWKWTSRSRGSGNLRISRLLWSAFRAKNLPNLNDTYNTYKPISRGAIIPHLIMKHCLKYIFFLNLNWWFYLFLLFLMKNIVFSFNMVLVLQDCCHLTCQPRPESETREKWVTDPSNSQTYHIWLWNLLNKRNEDVFVVISRGQAVPAVPK